MGWRRKPERQVINETEEGDNRWLSPPFPVIPLFPRTRKKGDESMKTSEHGQPGRIDRAHTVTGMFYNIAAVMAILRSPAKAKTLWRHQRQFCTYDERFQQLGLMF